MMFRHLITPLIVVLLAATSPVLGQGNSGSGSGNGSDQGNGNGNGENAEGQNGNANGSGNGAAGGGEGQNGNNGANGENGKAGEGSGKPQEPGNSGASNAGKSDAGNNSVAVPSGNNNLDDGNVVTLSPDEALEAVRSQQAATLADIVETVRNRAGGDIIDANLLKVGQMLIYAIKVLDQNGYLSIQYYYARSGRYIGSE